MTGKLILTDDQKRAIIVNKLAELHSANAVASDAFLLAIAENDGVADAESRERMLIASNMLAGAVSMVHLFYPERRDRFAIYDEARGKAQVR